MRSLVVSLGILIILSLSNQTANACSCDGTPVANAHLSIKDVTERDDGTQYGLVTDEQGKFRINGYIGQQLVIEARSNRQDVREESKERSEKLRVSLEKAAETIRIVIIRLQ